MTCPLSPMKWWQDYVAGRLRTPQSIVRAAEAEAAGPADKADRFFGIPDDPPVWDAPARLKAPAHFRSESYMRQIRRADWTHCDPRLMLWAALFQRLAEKREIPLYVHTALRSKAEQAKVNHLGNSKAAYPRSAHNIGEAVDIVHGTYHWDMSKAEWDLLHVLGRLALDRVNTILPAKHRLELTWGGYFKTLWDPAHWEITDYRNRIRALPEPVQPRNMAPAAILEAHRIGTLLPEW